MSQQTLEFKTEMKQLMDIIVHSLYSHKEIFLRELISNAADAIDKIRFESLTNSELLEGDDKWGIRIVPDEEAGTLTISDNGVGMSPASIVEDLGTIARSGTKAFLEKLKEAKDESRPDLIGQFGVGFYSAFMVADRITVTSRMAGDSANGVQWSSEGLGTFTVDTVEKASRGTEIVLHLREEEKEWLNDWRLRSTIKRFSNFIEHPIVLVTTKKEEDKEPETTEDTINSCQAIWLRSKNDVEQDEYDEFYKHISHDHEKPLDTIHYAAEGTLEFKSLLFIPGRKPFDLFQRERARGLHLYVNRVFIMDDCEKLLPPYLDFIRGVVDSSDLPLNVSREMLQEDRLLAQIQKNLVKKVLSTLKKMMKDDPEKYIKFWEMFGVILKAGLTQDWENKDALADLLYYESLSNEAGSYTTLSDYVDAMPADQEEIYYLIGENRTMVENSPYMESIRAKGYDVLVMTDPVDEMVVQSLMEYKEKKLKAVDKGDVEADEKDKEKSKGFEKEYKKLLKYLSKTLEDVKEVRLSHRLKESPACLVGEEGSMGAQMEQILKEMGADAPKQERILEINPEHETILAMNELFAKDKKDPRLEDYAGLVYDTALLASGAKIKNPALLAKRVSSLILRDAQVEK